jgi:hypothetical protein
MAAPSALPVGVPGASITPKFQVRVRYYKRMTMQRVYRMVVELRTADKGAAPSVSAGDSVIARPVIPGAYVQPVEQELGPKSTNHTITFSVAPLARGRLKNARLQILHQGRVLEEIWTPMRGTSQRLTWLFALLALVSLGYLINIFGPLPNLSSGASADENGTNVGRVLVDKLPDYLNKEELPEFLAFLTRDALAVYAQDRYNDLYALPNLNFYLVAGFLLLTIVSFLWNRPARRRRKGKPMMLPSLPSGAGHPLAFSAGH